MKHMHLLTFDLKKKKKIVLSITICRCFNSQNEIFFMNH